MGFRAAAMVGALLVGAMVTAGCGNGGRQPSPPSSASSTPGSSSTEVRSVSTGPPKKVFDHTAMATSVRRVLETDFKLRDLGEVSCPPNQEVRIGAAFDCTVPVQGRPKKVPISVRTEDGQYEVGTPQ